MRDFAGMLARAGAGVINWIADLGPYSWNEVMFAIVLMLGAILGIVIAFYLAARRNRAIEFVDQSEVLTSPLRNRTEPQWTAREATPPRKAEDNTPDPTRETAKPASAPIVPSLATPRPLTLAATPAKTVPIRAQLVLEPLSAGSGNVAEIAHANAITQRLKIVLAALAPHIAVERNAEAFGNAKLDRFILTGGVRHMGDRIRLQVELSDANSGANLFRFRYQGLPNEQDVMLAEITSRILKATAHATPDKKSDAA